MDDRQPRLIAWREPPTPTSRVRSGIIAMVARDLDDVGLAKLAPLILKPLRRMRGVRPAEMAARMGISPRAYRDFEAGRTGLLLTRIYRFAEILRLDHVAILAAFHLRKPRIAHAFAQNKFMLVQASAVDEFSEEMQDAIAAVDPLTVLDAHLQFYAQLADLGRAQLQAAGGGRAQEPANPLSPD